MRKMRIKLRKIYPVIWSGIIVISIYLLVRFTALSFSDNIGQADLSFIDSVFSGLSCKVLKEGACLVSYSANGKTQYEFPIQLAADKLALANFSDGNTVMTAQAQEYSSLLKGNVVETDGKESTEAMNSSAVLNEIARYKVSEKNLSTEYILTNGATYNRNMDEAVQKDGSTDELQVGYEDGEVNFEETEDGTSLSDSDSAEVANVGGAVKYTLAQLKDLNFLVQNFYIVDSSTKVTEKLFDADKLLGIDMTMKQDNKKPQILIYHTHSQEGYTDSSPGKAEDTVVGVGDCLTDILEDEYGYDVIHDTTTYDIVNGAENRNVAYSKAEDGITKILKDNPTIEVVIDLHRDSGAARTVEINGKETAKVMLFNGLSRDQNGPITYLDNPNLQDNLAFSLQLQLKSMELYPGLFNKNYLKCYRYNMQVCPKCLLVELGTVNNTLQSAKNAMEPFAEVLDAVLQGE